MKQDPSVYSFPSPVWVCQTKVFICLVSNVKNLFSNKERPGHILICYSLASHRGGPCSLTGLVKWDLWWTKWRWGRFSPSTSVSPANLHSTNCSTIILIYHLGLYNRPEVAAVPGDVSPPPLTTDTTTDLFSKRRNRHIYFIMNQRSTGLDRIAQTFVWSVYLSPAADLAVSWGTTEDILPTGILIGLLMKPIHSPPPYRIIEGLSASTWWSQF
jgi:hypothetical protein